MTSICGKCGARIPARQEACPECDPPKKKTEPIPMFMVVALLCSSFLVVGTSIVNVQTAPVAKQVEADSDLNMAAYDAAKQFINHDHQGVQSFSEFFQSEVAHKGRAFTVTLATDEVTTNAQPVRNFYHVELMFTNSSWQLQSIKQ